ncbi:MAG: hypothetical protein IPL71_13490 [Anaerolineales bacterium]|uniref:hypothetical protein n=1 Tax=Candidatus Villigracilis proximus TaxID=3140683 RepID=UPI0031348CE7|nr:hypothetical protein [Anaerolineales bacterium]
MSSSLSGQTLINQYHVEEFIALTPLGELYRATDIRNGKPLALTLLSKTISITEENQGTGSASRSTPSHYTSQYNFHYLGVFQTPTLAFLLEEWIDGPTSARDHPNTNTCWCK